MKEMFRIHDKKCEKVTEKVRAGLGQRFLSLSLLAYDMVGLTLSPESLLETAEYLRDTPGLEFQFLSCLSGVDRQDRLEVVYHLHSLTAGVSLQLTVSLPNDRPEVDSVTSIWPGANWYEREAYDMYGIVFRGHPNLTRILTDDEFVGHPLRKSYWTEGGLV